MISKQICSKRMHAGRKKIMDYETSECFITSRTYTLFLVNTHVKVILWYLKNNRYSSCVFSHIFFLKFLIYEALHIALTNLRANLFITE